MQQLTIELTDAVTEASLIRFIDGTLQKESSARKDNLQLTPEREYIIINPADTFVLLAGTPDDLPFSGAGDDVNTEITDVVFARASVGKDLDFLSRILAGLTSLTPDASLEFATPAYLDSKISLLQHLIVGPVDREINFVKRGSDTKTMNSENIEYPNELTNEIADRGFLLACSIAQSPLVAATRAGWRYQLNTRPALDVLWKLLELPIPNEATGGGAVNWPDPLNLLVDAFHPISPAEDDAKSESEVESSEDLPRIAIRELGQAIADAVRRSARPGGCARRP